jgi:hypothetical protein
MKSGRRIWIGLNPLSLSLSLSLIGLPNQNQRYDEISPNFFCPTYVYVLCTKVARERGKLMRGEKERRCGSGLVGDDEA